MLTGWAFLMLIVLAVPTPTIVAVETKEACEELRSNAAANGAQVSETCVPVGITLPE